MEVQLTVDPDAEAQEIEVALSFDWIPAEIRIALLDQLCVGLQTAAGQVDGDLFKIVLPEEKFV